MTNNTPPIDPALVSPEVWNQVQAMMLSMLQQGQLSVLPAPIVPSDPLPSPASLIPPDIVNPSVVSSLDSNMSDRDQSDLQEPPSKSPQAIICSKPNNPDDIDHPDKIDQPGQMNRDDGNVRDDDNSDEDFVPVDIDSNCKPQAVVKSPQDRLVPLALGDHHQAPPLITNLEEFDYTTGGTSVLFFIIQSL
ncbi:hypothetical protein MJO28_016598 [Puccinia striiformis f. sp. tritici]|uniref:Uncharacterized protein n=1 Tax=Puccinia striiformis f. sp. tritici TaxID=168172 RepID=A0ACC0DNL6_9BASI|nr:hypothetical protein MJO28_016598 [Puccinia striiformis f. sp. tritici]